MDQSLETLHTLHELVGTERSVDEVARALYFAVSSLRRPIVGALQVTCADESELETTQAFQHGFVQYLLPELKFAHQAPMRLANLGGRYEWGAAQIAENHFATQETADRYKLLLVKLNAHVGVISAAAGDSFGWLQRYGTLSPCCGALAALLGGGQQPFAEDLREAFCHVEGVNRLDALHALGVDASQRALLAAVVSARTQARRAAIDIQSSTPATPTVYVIAPCVSLNREGRDTEVLCGLYTIDHRTAIEAAHYYGLGDDPSAYRLGYRGAQLEIRDDHLDAPRPARDHRRIIMGEWRQRRAQPPVADPRVDAIWQQLATRGPEHAKPLLAALLPLLLEIAPIPAAMALFGNGATAAYHVYRAHRLAKPTADVDEAREILRELHAAVDDMPPERAHQLLEVLRAEYTTRG